MESSVHGGVLAIGKTSLMSQEGAKFTVCKKVERQRQDMEGGDSGDLCSIGET